MTNLITIAGLPWVGCVARKRHSCTFCIRDIPPGSKLYRPLRDGNGYARCDRACEGCATYRKTAALEG